MTTRRRATGTAGASSRTTSPRRARDGKSTYPCPNCGTQYRIPQEKLDDSIKCANCGRVFVPTASSQRGLAKKSSATPFVVGGGVLVGAIVIGIMIANSGGAPVAPVKPIAVAPETGMNNPRVRDVAEWVEALQKANDFKLKQTSDWAELARFLAVGKDTPPADLSAAVITELLGGTRSAFLRVAELTSASIKPDQAAAASGWVEVHVILRKPDEKKKYQRDTGEYRVSFRSAEGRFVVVGWEAMYEPPPKAPPDPNLERAVTHAILGKAQDVQRTLDGQTFTAREAELKPLPHLDATPPEQQREIDEAVAHVVDLEGSPAQSNRAMDKLRRIGKPSVPRLLNQMYEIVTTTKLDSRDALLKLRRLEQSLEQLSGNRFGFDPSEGVVGNAGREEYRVSALKQWYGWWADNHASKKWNIGIEQDETLEPTPKPDPNQKDGAAKK
ncbi:MAG: zinc-ribbon domain-containing protein [Planctomycetes bacterium]|nr:zinc-ribbon domain-containing protein [Planctomycetota bacterium]